MVVTPLSTLIVPPFTPKLMPRFEFNVKLAVVCSEPPLSTNWPGVALTGAEPRFASALSEIRPALIVVTPL